MRNALAIVSTAAVLWTAPTPAPAAVDPLAESLAEIAAVAGRDLSVLTWDGQPAVRFMAGRLTASPTPDTREAGMLFVTRHAPALGASEGTSVRFERSLPLATGIVLRYRQHVGGIPVVGGEVALRFDRDGILRTVNSGMRPFDRIDPPIALVTAADATAAVIARPDVISAVDPAATWVGLVYYPAGGEARLAWQVETGAVPALAANWVAWVDARTGEILAKRNRIHFDRLANVFAENPVSTPTMIQTTLEDLPAWSSDPYYLTSALVLSRNCQDRHETVPVSIGGFTLDAHLCSEVQVATGDPTGHDFLFDDYEDTAPEDLFAEAAMFYHVTKAYNFFQSLGFGNLDERPLACTVNFRIPVDLSDGFDFSDLENAQNPDGALFPFDNAFFLPAGDSSAFIPRDRDSIVFGQGTGSDFSYDGDVVYHEFGHAVVDSTCSLEGATVDDQGIDIGPGALNEGYADIFAMFITDDPLMGEYAGGSLPPGGAIRDLVNDNRCPEDLIGEVHEDSLPWTGAAWEIYQALGTPVIQPYYDAMASLVSTADFAVAVRDTVAEIGTQLGATEAATAGAVFEARNLVACDRILEGGGAPTPLLMGEGTGTIGLSPYVPGYAMFRVSIPDGQTQIIVHFRASAGGMSSFTGGSIDPYVLFYSGPERLSFRYVGTTVRGNETYAVDPPRIGDSDYEAVYCESGATLAAGDHYVMVANRGEASMQMQGISVRYNNSEPAGPCIGGEDGGDGGTEDAADVPEEADGDGDGDAASGLCDPPTTCAESCRAQGYSGGACSDTPEGPRCSCSSSSGGCGCRAAGTGGTAGAVLALLGVLALSCARRRRR